MLGLVLTGQKKIDRAIECYEKGLKVDPKFAMIYSNLGLLLFNKKTSSSIKKAENFYIKSITLNEKMSLNSSKIFCKKICVSSNAGLIVLFG